MWWCSFIFYFISFINPLPSPSTHPSTHSSALSLHPSALSLRPSQKTSPSKSLCCTLKRASASFQKHGRKEEERVGERDPLSTPHPIVAPARHIRLYCFYNIIIASNQASRMPATTHRDHGSSAVLSPMSPPSMRTSTPRWPVRRGAAPAERPAPPGPRAAGGSKAVGLSGHEGAWNACAATRSTARRTTLRRRRGAVCVSTNVTANAAHCPTHVSRALTLAACAPTSSQKSECLGVVLKPANERSHLQLRPLTLALQSGRRPLRFEHLGVRECRPRGGLELSTGYLCANSVIFARTRNEQLSVRRDPDGILSNPSRGTRRSKVAMFQTQRSGVFLTRRSSRQCTRLVVEYPAIFGPHPPGSGLCARTINVTPQKLLVPTVTEVSPRKS